MSKSNETTPNVPTLRFKRYTTEWTKINLSNYLFVSSKRNKDGRFSKEDVLSVSGELGIVNQIALLGRSYAGESVLPYHIVEKGDIVYTKSPLALYPYGIIKTNRNKVGIVSTLYAVYKTKDNANNRFIEHYFSLKSRINNYLKPIVRIGAKHDMKIGNNEVLENIVAFPDISEQCEIADFLDLLDNRISVQNKIISDLKVLKKELNGFLISRLIKGKESNCKIEDVIDYEQPTDYIVNTDKYIVDGKTPVLTANKAFFLGYTNEKEGIYDKSDCIIFDDFTLDFKYVDFPFKVKSSAIKILTAKQSIELKYFYEYLLFLNLSTNEHKRHYISEIATLPLYLPSIDEQRHVLSILNAISSKIAVEEKYKTSLLIQKKYFLNAMFI